MLNTDEYTYSFISYWLTTDIIESRKKKVCFIFSCCNPVMNSHIQLSISKMADLFKRSLPPSLKNIFNSGVTYVYAIYLMAVGCNVIGSTKELDTADV